MTEIKNVDREAAAGYLSLVAPSFPNLADAIRTNPTAAARAFAAHREAAEKAERDRIVAWLRKVGSTASHGVFLDAIERGEHLK